MVKFGGLAVGFPVVVCEFADDFCHSADVRGLLEGWFGQPFGRLRANGFCCLALGVGAPAGSPLARG